MKSTEPFSCFADFWKLTQDLEEFQIQKILHSLPEEEQIFLLTEMNSGHWLDLIYRNRIDRLIDSTKNLFNVDLLDVRRKVIKGKTQYVSKTCWEYFIGYLFDEITDDERHYNYVLGNISSKVEGEAVCLTLVNKREKYG